MYNYLVKEQLKQYICFTNISIQAVLKIDWISLIQLIYFKHVGAIHEVA
jgi:hypothetical protein